MLLIVIQHYVVWGIKPSAHAVFHVNNIYTLCDYTLTEGLYLLSCIGVNCYILITGFYLINRTQYRWKSLCKIWTSTAFYSVTLFLIAFGLSGEGNFDLVSFAKCFFPIYSDQYWFITKYIGLMLLSPFMAIMVSRLSERSYRLLLLIMFVMGFMFPYGKIFAGGKSLIWMVFVYLTGGYIKLYGVPQKITRHIGIITIAILCALTMIIVGAEFIMHSDISTLTGQYQLHSFASDSPIFFLSTAIFIWISRTSSTSDNQLFKLCVYIAPMILGVYLIHMNKYLYSFIWDVVIPDVYIIPWCIHALLSGIIIFIACLCIDYLRIQVFKITHINDMIDFVSSKIKITEIK